MTRARAQPFTDCKLRMAYADEPPPPDGSFLVTPAGSAYLVRRVAGRTLHVTRWPLDEVPADAEVITWRWVKR